ncbi:hypothetical protein C2G38_2176446 [Gigaspora rosea]|uniref:Uncharacterized protein n=1 Tax=Gigaspora rosea TaxID=44941 RepID=A0A397VKH9_9GLOM|nr:hypothetical protein C2G38_2176446 [Gigaspora rosea]
MLTSLDLTDRKGAKRGKHQLKNTTLTALNLSESDLECYADFSFGSLQSSLSEAGKALAKEHSPNPSRSNLGSEGENALADALCKNTSLNKVVKALADALCKNTALTSLKFSKNNLGSEGGNA